jgi:hypothetical protein
MRGVSLGWLIAGTVFGGMGFAYNLMVLAAIINGVLVSHEWVVLGVFLCPWVVPLRNLWCILALNCALYGSLFAGLRLMWNGAGNRTASN